MKKKSWMKRSWIFLSLQSFPFLQLTSHLYVGDCEQHENENYSRPFSLSQFVSFFLSIFHVSWKHFVSQKGSESVTICSVLRCLSHFSVCKSVRKLNRNPFIFFLPRELFFYAVKDYCGYQRMRNLLSWLFPLLSSKKQSQMYSPAIPWRSNNFHCKVIKISFALCLFWQLDNEILRKLLNWNFAKSFPLTF